MSLRIIPRLEIKGANLVKGIHMDGLRVLGCPWDFAQAYYEDGADEIIYTDVVASLYERKFSAEVIKRTTQSVFVPITVGGGIRSLEDIESLLNAGADKVAINTAALKNPEFITSAAKTFGAQCIVLAIEAQYVDGRHEPYTENGREPSGRDVKSWALEGIDRGAGEILLTSVNNEGTHKGFDVDLCKLLAEDVPVPVTVAGGAGQVSHISQLLGEFRPEGISCSSLFHYHYLPNILETSEESASKFDKRSQRDVGNAEPAYEFAPSSIRATKKHLHEHGVPVRL